MPKDYLGSDQRKTKEKSDEEEKPIQCKHRYVNISMCVPC